MLANRYVREIIGLAVRDCTAGCTIGEVTVIFVERRVGASKVSPRVLMESLVLPWRLLGRRLRQVRAVRLHGIAIAPASRVSR